MSNFLGITPEEIQMQTYYTIVNILDYYATTGEVLDSMIIEHLNWLSSKSDNSIEDIGDANDVPNAKTWSDIVNGFKELYKTGDRIRVE